MESPLKPYLLRTERWICQGHKELQVLFEKLAERKPAIRQYYKQNFFTEGQTLILECPRQLPDGEQMDFVEVMEIEDSLIRYHRVYWGWRELKVI